MLHTVEATSQCSINGAYIPALTSPMWVAIRAIWANIVPRPVMWVYDTFRGKNSVPCDSLAVCTVPLFCYRFALSRWFGCAARHQNSAGSATRPEPFIIVPALSICRMCRSWPHPELFGGTPSASAQRASRTRILRGSVPPP